MFLFFRKNNIENTSEGGFVLILSVVILLMVSLFGIWVLQSSTSEMQVASGAQQLEAQFNITEGASYQEAGKIGFAQVDHYKVTNPKNTGQLLFPKADANNPEDFDSEDFDPGEDTDAAPADVKAGLEEVDTWPWGNLLEDIQSSNDQYDYRYLTTYLHPDSPPLGYDMNYFSSYKFRIQTAASQKPVFVELGGSKIGPK